MDAPSPEEFYNQMKEYAVIAEDDEELCHEYMDEYLCKVLSSLGYSRGVNVFRTTPKWYS